MLKLGERVGFLYSKRVYHGTFQEYVQTTFDPMIQCYLELDEHCCPPPWNGIVPYVIPAPKGRIRCATEAVFRLDDA